MVSEHVIPETRSRKQLIVFIILAFLLAAYSSFITADIFTANSENLYSRIIKYCTILVCLVLTLLIGKDGHDARDKRLLQGALLLHATGDFCISALGKFDLALVFFFFMQLLYITRHSRNFKINKKEIISFLVVYIPVSVVFVIISPKLQKAGIFIPVLVYTLALTTSVWIGIGTLWRKYYTRTISAIIAIAMISFFFCDLNVGLYNSLSEESKNILIGFMGLSRPLQTASLIVPGDLTWISDLRLSIPISLREIIGIFVWFFYLPAVALLSLSGYRIGFIRSIFPLLPDLKTRIVKN